MTYKTEMVQKIYGNLNKEEIESLHRAYDIVQEFRSIVNATNPTTDIVSDRTGECFTLGELGRVCGILAALVDEDNHSWTAG